MKKISYIIASLIIFININSCVGYKPIFDSTNIQFKIINHSIEGNKKLGNKIYTKLYNLSKSNKNNPEAKDVDIIIKVSKDKSSTAKDDAGKIIEYKINLNSQIIIKDYVTNLENLNQSFNSYASYKVQDEYSETLKLENKTIENLLDKTYQDLLLKMSENIFSK
jgi:hypothetical protein